MKKNYSFKRKELKTIMAVHSANIDNVVCSLKANKDVKKIKVESLTAFDDNKNPIFGYKVTVTYSE